MKKFLLGVGVALLTVEAALTMIWASDGWDELTEEIDRKMSNNKPRVWLRQKYRDMVADNEAWDSAMDGLRKFYDEAPDLPRPLSANEIRSRRGLPPL